MTSPSSSVPNGALNVYTDIRGLQGLKREKDQSVALQKIAKQFESMFLQEMLKTMRKANEVFEEGSLFNGGDTAFYRDMYDQQLSLTLAQKGTGLSDTLYQQLNQQYVKKSESKDGQTLSKDGHSLSKEERPLKFEANDRRVVSEPHFNTVKKIPENSDPLFSMLHSVFNGEEVQPTDETADMVQSIFNAPVTAAPTSNTLSDTSDTDDLPEYALNFVKKVLPHAQKAAKLLSVNPLLLTAQAALETGWGQYVIKGQDGQNSHNLFNIKAGKNWQGESASVVTLEYYKGVPVKERADFRQYGNFSESFQDYVNLIAQNPRYQQALSNASNEHQYAHELQKAGYATDPQYANKVLSIYQQLNKQPDVLTEIH